MYVFTCHCCGGIGQKLQNAGDVRQFTLTNISLGVQNPKNMKQMPNMTWLLVIGNVETFKLMNYFWNNNFVEMITSKFDIRCMAVKLDKVAHTVVQT